MTHYVAEAYRAAFDLVQALINWVLLYPLTWAVPRSRRQIVVIGREDGRFTDNAKHFFIFASANTDRENSTTFLTEDRRLCAELRSHGARAVHFPSFRSLWVLARAGTVVFDSAEWVRKGRFQLAQGACRVQIWHGVPLKEIELPLFHKRLGRLATPWRQLLLLQKWITGRYARCHVLISTSAFITKRAFADAFRAERIVETGYPRNDVFLATPPARGNMVWINTDEQALERIRRARSSGWTVCLYAPTFRQQLSDPFSTKSLDLVRLERFAADNGLLVVIKLHPVMSERYEMNSLEHVTEYDAASDVYPALPMIDLLVTDYSSIYFDYLLLDRPIIFFVYDLDSYVSGDRALLFDFDQMAPGERCSTQDELERTIVKLSINSRDDYAEHRRTVRELVFDHRDCYASQRLWENLVARCR